MPESPVDVLRRWEDSGAHWRVESMGEDRAIVVLCACTGEPVDQIESSDPQLLSFLRERQPDPPLTL
jgi:hypothetical protein